MNKTELIDKIAAGAEISKEKAIFVSKKDNKTKLLIIL